MLAVLRPSMGSSKPPGHGKVFGYSFDSTVSTYPFPSPPAPAPGPSLLDDNESKFLDNFFDGVSSDQFNADFFSTAADGMDDMGFNWQDLPPAFMGTTSSFGQQPLIPNNEISTFNFPDMNLDMDMASSRHPATTSPDVLAAASLLQNGPSRSQNGNDVLFATQDLSLVMAPHHNNPATQSMMTYSQPRQRITLPKQDAYVGDTYYAELMFGPAAGDGRPHPRGPPKSVDIHWGSDAGFGSGQGFVAPPGQESVETIEQKLMHVIECVEAKESTAASSCPNSPVAIRHAEPTMRHDDQALNGRNRNEDDDDESRPKKKRKNKVKEDDEDEEVDETINKAPRKRKLKLNAPTSSTTQSPPPSKRRKSGSAVTVKQSRENLTEDQKRENHIRSEQKRRTLIKEGFDDLNELVPGLRGGGHSKSIVLVMAADWLEDLIEGNKVLKERLQNLEAVTGGNGM